MNTNQKILFIASWTGIVSAMVLLLLAGFWMFYPYKTTDYNNLPQKLDKRIVYGGQFLVIRVDFCKYTEVIPTISRSFVDGIVYTIPPYTGVDTKLGCHIRNAQIYIPKGLPPGKYHITTNYRWVMNPLRTIEKINSTVDFEVRQITSSALLIR